MSSIEPPRHSTEVESVDPVNRLLAGGFVAVWALAGWWSHLRNDQIVGVDFGVDPGPGLLPAIALCILTGGAVALMAAGLLGLRGTAGNWPDPRHLARQSAMPLLLVATLAGYVPLVRAVGFLPANICFAFAWMVLLTGRRVYAHPKRVFSVIAAGALIGVGLVYALFIRWIGVPL